MRENLAARHPLTATAKWRAFADSVREAAIRGAEHRATRDHDRQRATDYARTDAGLPTKE